MPGLFVKDQMCCDCALFVDKFVNIITVNIIITFT